MPDTASFLRDIASSNADTRFAAWRSAHEVDPEALPELGKLAASDNPGVAKAAREAITTMTHGVGKDASNPKRAGVIKGLIDLAGPAYALPVRVHALRSLSLIAGEDNVPAIAKWLHDADLREEAAYCLERIPGKAPNQAFVSAYRSAKDDFKPRILAALGHRRAEEGVPICLEAMRSLNKDLAIAGARAFGRIGRKPAAGVRFIEPAGLTDWEKVEHMDSQLRYADAQVKAGNLADAMKIYKSALARPEPHWQCAGVIGIAGMGTPEAAAAVFPLLKSPNRQVRITARQAWDRMAKNTGA